MWRYCSKSATEQDIGMPNNEIRYGNYLCQRVAKASSHRQRAIPWFKGLTWAKFWVSIYVDAIHRGQDLELELELRSAKRSPHVRIRGPRAGAADCLKPVRSDVGIYSELASTHHHLSYNNIQARFPINLHQSTQLYQSLFPVPKALIKQEPLSSSAPLHLRSNPPSPTSTFHPDIKMPAFTITVNNKAKEAVAACRA